MVLTKDIKIPIYCAEIRVVFTDNMLATFNKYMSSNSTEEVDFEAVAIDVGSNCLVLYKNKLSYSTIIHELYHAVTTILTQRDIKPCEATEEAYSYLIGYVSGEVFKYINSHLDQIKIIK
jgi:hypothetical protein